VVEEPAGVIGSSAVAAATAVDKHQGDVQLDVGASSKFSYAIRGCHRETVDVMLASLTTGIDS
jgi:hypothetical protein